MPPRFAAPHALPAATAPTRLPPRAADAPLSEGLAASLLDAILAGRYRPGERLPPERRLAARLGIGRSTVREAYQHLEQLGLVAIRHGGGATVLRVEDASLEVLRHLLVVDGLPDAKLVDQLLEVNELLLTAAVRLAVERASPEELARARGLLRRLARPDLADADSFAALEELMQLMSVASRNLVLRLVRNGLKALFTPDRSRRMPARWRPRRSEIAATARGLEAALSTRAAEAAEGAVRELLRTVRRRIRARPQRPPARSPQRPPARPPESPQASRQE